jgi:ankyrin repeat protein
MEVPNIRTTEDLITAELLKGETDFVDKLKQLNFPGTTTISDLIGECIDDNMPEDGELLKLLSDRKYGVETAFGIMSPFEYALLYNKFLIADKMLECGFDINSQGLHFFGLGKVPIIALTIWYNLLGSFKFVLSKSPNLEIKFGDNQETPLIFASRLFRFDFMELLLHAEADPMSKNKYGTDAIAYNEGHPIKDKILAKYKVETLADLIVREIRRGNKDVVDTLNGFNMDPLSSIYDVVVKCVKENNIEIIKLVVTDFNAISSEKSKKNSLLTLCVDNSNIEILEYFLDSGANINERSSLAGWTLLVFASHEDKFNLVQFLLKRKADVNVLTDSKNTALNLALKWNRLDIAEVLINAGTITSIKNIRDFDALSIHKYNIKGRNSNPEQWRKIKNLLIDKSEKKPIDPRENATEPEKKIIEQQKTCVCTNGKGKEIAIPEDIVIEIFHDTNLKFDPETMKKTHKRIKGFLRIEKLIDGKWVKERLNFPECQMEFPEGFKGKCHVLPANFIFADETVIRFIGSSHYCY